MKKNKIAKTFAFAAILMGTCCLPAMAGDSGWRLVGEDWYYYDESSNKITDDWIVEKIGTTPNLVAYYVNAEGKWIEDMVYTGCEGSWIDKKFCRKDGTYPKEEFEFIDGKWYFFDANGNMVTGLVQNKETENFHYFYPNGAMAERAGWIELPDQSWIYVSGKICLANTVTPDGCQMDQQAKWKKGSAQTIETDLVRITVPASWEGKYLYRMGEPAGTISFYEKESFNKTLADIGEFGGRLMTVVVGTEGNYRAITKIIPTKLVGRKGEKVCYIEYPSDVQSVPEWKDQYDALSADIDRVISGIYIK